MHANLSALESLQSAHGYCPVATEVYNVATSLRDAWSKRLASLQSEAAALRGQFDKAQRDAGANDSVTLDEMLETIRNVETQIQKLLDTSDELEVG